MSRLTRQLRRLRTHSLNRLHKTIDWLTMDRGSWRATVGKTELSGLTIDSAHRDVGVFYWPTFWRVLDWVHAALPEDKADWTFVDLGSGKGRAVLSAGLRPYRRVIGVEFASELVASARALVAAAQGLRAGSVEILHMDAAQYALPDGPVVIFLFDPFGQPVIDAVAASIARSYARNPRPIVIAYLNPRFHDRFKNLDGFTFVRLDRRSAMRFRLLSPYRLALYATPECHAPWR